TSPSSGCASLKTSSRPTRKRCARKGAPFLSNTETSMKNLSGPLLVLGAGGFIGGHLYRQLRAVRTDVYGTFSPTAKTGLLSEARFHADLETHARAIVEIVKPAT